MQKASDYFYLENVPKAYPMDLLYVDLGHMMINLRPEFGIKDAGSMLLVFKDGGCRLFLETEKWFAAGQKILDYTLESDERVALCEKRIERWTEYLAQLAELYKRTDFSMYQNQSLCEALDIVNSIERINGLQNVDIASPNYGTNFIHKKLEQTLKDLGFAPHAIMPILLRTTKALAVLEYEKALGEAALIIQKNNSAKSEQIDSLLDRFAWLDASFGAEPKSTEGVTRDIDDLLSFGNDLPRIIDERKKFKTEKEEEQKRVMAEVTQKASPEQKRTIRFACSSSELGSVLVDEIMRFIYYKRNIYKEFASRLNVSENDVKHLLPDELKNYVRSDEPVNTKIIDERKKITILILENNTFELQTGPKAEKFLEELIAVTAQDNTPMKGEIAFSAGKVKGIAKLVTDSSDMYKVKEGDILVSSRTYPDLLPAMKRSKAIIAELGGLLSHAAIVSRELHIPCVVGVRNATSRIKDGDMVEVDTVSGAVTILKP